ncbi:MAG: MBL fold metallo-hydrolase [Lentisphaerae bacterium]|nr:MBL fold metallo-hydrolase [Lentisphaerota bacterium]
MKNLPSDSRWRGWKRGELQIHFIHAGVGESLFWIFPDGTTMLLDCGATDTRGREPAPVLPDASRPAGDWVARYVTRVNPAADKTRVDIMMLSHYHADHTHGFPAAAETLHFTRAFDRAWPECDDPCRISDYDQDGSLAVMRKLYADLVARDGLVVEKFVEGRRDQVRMLHGGAEGFSIFNLCANGRMADERTGEITDLYQDYPDRQPGFSGKQWINENGMSLGMIVRYGAFSFFTAGDFSDKAQMPEGFERFEIEDRLATVAPPVSLAKMNHHGYFAMPEKLVKALRPRAWVNGVWTHRQNSADTIRRLADRALYPGDRAICPTFMPPERPCSDVPDPAYGGAHVVVSAPPGGETFSISFLSATDESMRVLAVNEYASGADDHFAQ